MERKQVLTCCLIIALAAQSVHAEAPGWEFSLGGGVGGENVYLGSDDYYLTPLPSASASYTRGSINYSLSLLEGLGITYVIPDWGLMASVNVNAGAIRNSKEYSVLGVWVEHSEETSALLAGSPNLDTPLALTTTLAFASPVGLLGASAALHPTSVEFPESGREDVTRKGMLYSLLYMVGTQPTQRLSVSGLLSLEIMDRTFADTWYSVEQPTEALSVFKAEGGLRSGMVALEGTYRVSERVSLEILAATTALMGDAEDSPYTTEAVQRTLTTQFLYHF